MKPFAIIGALALSLLGADSAHAQDLASIEVPRAASSSSVAQLPDTPPLPDAPQPGSELAQQPSQPAKPTPADAQQGHQTKRILGIIPNFRAVSADVKLPPQTTHEKLLTGIQDSFDYSGFTFVAAQAGVNYAEDATPEFQRGWPAYGRYFWHTFVDNADENLMVESFLPVVTHEDSRYYTLGHGSLAKRTVYALSRAVITRTDSGRETFNVSEVFGAGAAAGISTLYYPGPERTLSKTTERWLTSVLIDAATFAVKEFWPDINRVVFHQSAD